MTWTLVPSGDGWQVTGSPIDGPPGLDWTYSYAGAAGEGTMMVTNGDVGGLEPFDSSPAAATIDGHAGVVHQGNGIAWVTLDGVDDLIATIEAFDEATTQAMVASLKVQQTAQVATDQAPSSTVLVSASNEGS